MTDPDTEARFVLDSYAARSCPMKTVNAFNPTLTPPDVTFPVPHFFHDPDEVETEVFGRILAAPGLKIVDLRATRGQPSADQEAATLAALAAGVDLIVGGLLPRDYTGHRSGRPSLLLRVAEGGYVPVQVKFHKVLGPAPVGPDQTYSTLDDPHTVHRWPGKTFRWKQRIKAALQVAHTWRLLQATGFAAAKPVVGVIGTERVSVPHDPANRAQQPIIVWLDLEAATVPPNPATVPNPEEADLISTLERYDYEHARRVELAARARNGANPPTPIVNRECSFCVWQDYCASQLDDDDLSLRINKAPLDVHEVRVLRELGISTVADLADVNLDAVLDKYLPRVSHRSGGEERLRLAHRRARLINEGVALERQTEGPLPVPSAGLEIDLDIETSAEDRVYLWGFEVDDRDRGERYYKHFSSFAELDAASERKLAVDAWEWLRDLVAGREALVYHYSDYEVVRLRRLVTGCHRHPDEYGVKGRRDVLTWITDYAASNFVDLFGLVRANFFGANGLGLKVVATAVTEFEWRDEDPSGLNSQRWFDEAVHATDVEARDHARVRVLEYNEDDVCATWHLRHWLRSLD